MFTGRKLPLTLAFAALLLIAFGAGCKGFFPPNTLQTVTIQPTTLNLGVGAQQQFTAYGTYQDGSRSQITSGLVWTSSDSVDLPITSGGLVTGVNVTSSAVTITGDAQGLSGTGTVTVVGDVTSMTVNPTSATVTAGGSPIIFTFAASPGPPKYVNSDNGGTLAIVPNDNIFTCVASTDANQNPVESCSLSTTGGAAASYTLQMSYTSASGGTVLSQPIATVTVQ